MCHSQQYNSQNPPPKKTCARSGKFKLYSTPRTTHHCMRSEVTECLCQWVEILQPAPGSDLDDSWMFLSPREVGVGISQEMRF